MSESPSATNKKAEDGSGTELGVISVTLNDPRKGGSSALG